MPPITNRGCCTDDRPSHPSRKLVLTRGSWNPARPFKFTFMCTGRGSIRSSPCRSMASPSQRDRSSFSAMSTADGRRRRTVSDERPRRTAQGRMLTPQCGCGAGSEVDGCVVKVPGSDSSVSLLGLLVGWFGCGCGWKERLKRWCGWDGGLP